MYAGIRPNEVVCGATISACRKSGLALESLEIFNYMIANQMRPNLRVFNTVIGALCSQKYVDRAIQVCWSWMYGWMVGGCMYVCRYVCIYVCLYDASLYV